MNQIEHTQSEEVLYTISEVAALLKVNKNMVYYLINAGYLRSIKLGCRKVTRKALLSFLEQHDGDVIPVPDTKQRGKTST